MMLPKNDLKTWSRHALLALLVTLALVFNTSPIQALDPVDELQKQIDELAKLKQLSVDATKPLEAELNNLETKIKNAQNGIAQAKKQATALSEDIEEREGALAVQYQILSKRIGEDYKRGRVASPFLILLANNDAAALTKGLAYQESVQAQDNRIIRETSGDIAQLETVQKQEKLIENLIKNQGEQATAQTSTNAESTADINDDGVSLLKKMLDSTSGDVEISADDLANMTAVAVESDEPEANPVATVETPTTENDTFNIEDLRADLTTDPDQAKNHNKS